MQSPKVRQLSALAELSEAGTAKFRESGAIHLTSSTIASLSCEFSKNCSKLARAVEAGLSAGALQRLEKLAALCRRLYFGLGHPPDFGAAVIRCFTEFQYPVDLTAAFHDDGVALRYAREADGDRAIVTRSCVRVSPYSVVRLERGVTTVTVG
jgi:hypothetical protein